MEVWNDSQHAWGGRERVEALRQEVAAIQEQSAYMQMPRPGFVAMENHARRDPRLQEILAELKSMTDWKKP